MVVAVLATNRILANSFRHLLLMIALWGVCYLLFSSLYRLKMIIQSTKTSTFNTSSTPTNNLPKKQEVSLTNANSDEKKLMAESESKSHLFLETQPQKLTKSSLKLNPQLPTPNKDQRASLKPTFNKVHKHQKSKKVLRKISGLLWCIPPIFVLGTVSFIFQFVDQITREDTRYSTLIDETARGPYLIVDDLQAFISIAIGIYFQYYSYVAFASPVSLNGISKLIYPFYAMSRCCQSHESTEKTLAIIEAVPGASTTVAIRKKPRSSNEMAVD